MRDPTAGAIWTVTARDDVLKSLAECHDRAANGVAIRLLNRTSELDRIPLRTMTDLAEREGEALLADQAKWARRVLSFHGWDPDTLLPTPAAEQASHGIVGDGIVHLLTRTGRRIWVKLGIVDFGAGSIRRGTGFRRDASPSGREGAENRA